MTITESMLQKAYDTGVLKICSLSDIDSNQATNNTGTIAVIGDNWFWFGGETAEELTPDEYIANVGVEDTLREVLETLNGFQNDPCEELNDEYAYYEAILTENGIN